MCVHVVVWLLNSIPMDCSPPGSSVHGIFQEYWSGVSFPTPGDPPDSGIKSTSLASPALAGVYFTNESPGEPLSNYIILERSSVFKQWNKIVKFILNMSSNTKSISFL